MTEYKPLLLAPNKPKDIMIEFNNLWWLKDIKLYDKEFIKCDILKQWEKTFRYLRIKDSEVEYLADVIDKFNKDTHYDNFDEFCLDMDFKFPWSDGALFEYLKSFHIFSNRFDLKDLENTRDEINELTDLKRLFGFTKIDQFVNKLDKQSEPVESIEPSGPSKKKEFDDVVSMSSFNNIVLKFQEETKEEKVQEVKVPEIASETNIQSKETTIQETKDEAKAEVKPKKVRKFKIQRPSWFTYAGPFLKSKRSKIHCRTDCPGCKVSFKAIYSNVFVSDRSALLKKVCTFCFDISA